MGQIVATIVSVLSDMDAEIATLKQFRDKTKQIKQGMIQSAAHRSGLAGQAGAPDGGIRMIEDQNIEWKASWRDEYLKWICGFANAQGGVLEIGKNDRGEVVSLPHASKLLEDLPNKIRDLLGIIVDVDLQNEAGKEFVRITVEPYPYPISYKGEYHYRSGSTKQVLKGAALDHFLLRKTGKHWDGVPVPGLTVGNLDSHAIDRFRELAARSKRVGPEVLAAKNEVLVGKLRLTDGDYLNRAAVLLFHSDPESFVTGAYIKIGYFKSGSSQLRQGNPEKDSNYERGKREKACIARKDAKNAKKSANG